MAVRRSSPFVVALLCAALLAGCGSSSTSTTNGSTTTSAPVTSSTATPSSPAAATTSTSPAASPTSAGGVAQYVAICKSIVQREPTLSAAVKGKVEGICDKAASGDLAGARTAAKEVCVEVINASPIPAAAKQKALVACKQS